jgi:hypothetical protein
VVTYWLPGIWTRCWCGSPFAAWRHWRLGACGPQPSSQTANIIAWFIRGARENIQGIGASLPQDGSYDQFRHDIPRCLHAAIAIAAKYIHLETRSLDSGLRYFPPFGPASRWISRDKRVSRMYYLLVAARLRHPTRCYQTRTHSKGPIDLP